LIECALSEIIESIALFGHNVIKVFSGNFAAIGCGPLKHFLKLLDIHGFAQFLGNSSDVVGVDAARVIIVEKVEDLVDSVLRHNKATLVSLSPSLEVIPSRNSSKSTSLPRL